MRITVPNPHGAPLVIEIVMPAPMELATRALGALAEEFPEATVK